MFFALLCLLLGLLLFGDFRMLRFRLMLYRWNTALFVRRFHARLFFRGTGVLLRFQQLFDLWNTALFVRRFRARLFFRGTSLFLRFQQLFDLWNTALFVRCFRARLFFRGTGLLLRFRLMPARSPFHRGLFLSAFFPESGRWGNSSIPLCISMT